MSAGRVAALVVTTSSAFAHHARKAPGALQVCYCSAPAHFLWNQDEYFRSRARQRLLLAPLLRILRRLDIQAATRVDAYIANSRYTAGRIEAVYGREAQVVYPAVETSRFQPSRNRSGRFLVLSRLVPTKRVPDTDQKIVAAPDGTRVAVDHITFVINPFDAIALEEAVRISEASSEPVEVVAVGIGGAGYEQQLRTALAMGAARAVHVECGEPLDPWNVARVLAAVVEREQPALVLMGKQAVDDDANQAGQFLAALLDWPQATFASKVELMGREIRVERETDFGLEMLRLPLPAVVTTDLRLNEPRYASIAGIMKARKKPIDMISVADLNVAVEPRVETLRYHSSEKRRACERVKSVGELVERLQESLKECGR